MDVLTETRIYDNIIWIAFVIAHLYGVITVVGQGFMQPSYRDYGCKNPRLHRL